MYETFFGVGWRQCVHETARIGLGSRWAAFGTITAIPKIFRAPHTDLGRIRVFYTTEE